MLRVRFSSGLDERLVRPLGEAGYLAACLLLLVGLLACRDDELGAIEYPPKDVPLEWLDERELVSLDGPSTFAYELAADPITNRLVLLDFYADQPIVILETNGEIVARIGGRGEGPGEFEDVRTVTMHDGQAYVWDGSLKRLSSVSMDDPTTVHTLFSVTQEGRFVGEVVPLSGGGYLAIGKMGDALAVRFQDPTQAGVPIGSAPRNLADRREFIRVFNSMAYATVDEERDLLIVAYFTLGEIVFARLSTGETIRTTKPGSWPRPMVVPESGTWRESPDNFVGYRDVMKSAEGVWGFFSGNTWNKSHGPYGSRDVHVYGWDGELKQILRLSERIDGLAVLNGYLYGSVNDPIPAVVRWRIPDHVLDELRSVSD